MPVAPASRDSFFREAVLSVSVCLSVALTPAAAVQVQSSTAHPPETRPALPNQNDSPSQNGPSLLLNVRWVVSDSPGLWLGAVTRQDVSYSFLSAAMLTTRAADDYRHKLRIGGSRASPDSYVYFLGCHA